MAQWTAATLGSICRSYELRWLLKIEGSFQQALSDLFGRHVIDADHES
jgi:hypothetical protein